LCNCDGNENRQRYCLLRGEKVAETENVYAYHHIGEVLDHWTFKKGGKMSDLELRDRTMILVVQVDHLSIKENTTVDVFWREKVK